MDTNVDFLFVTTYLVLCFYRYQYQVRKTVRTQNYIIDQLAIQNGQKEGMLACSFGSHNMNSTKKTIMPHSLSNKTIQDNLELFYCLAMESKEGKDFLKYVEAFEV
jgi:hypothetical protein